VHLAGGVLSSRATGVFRRHFTAQGLPMSHALGTDFLQVAKARYSWWFQEHARS
jgi:hypothetical protein